MAARPGGGRAAAEERRAAGWLRGGRPGALRGREEARLLFCSPCSLVLRIEDSLSRLFARCGRVQSVDICDKPGPGEKKEKLASKFFNLKTVTVKPGGGGGGCGGEY